MESRRRSRRRKEKYFLNLKQQLVIASYCPEDSNNALLFSEGRPEGSNIISVNMNFSSAKSEINKSKTSHPAPLLSSVNAKTKLKQKLPTS